MSFVEYLYVDEKRLDSYFEQISSPVAYDKVPVWKAGLSVTTLGADATQSRFPRPYTKHEKITRLTKHLEENDLVLPLSSVRLLSLQTWQHGTSFYSGTFPATKVFIPAKPELSDTFPGLTLWFASLSSPSEGRHERSPEDLSNVVPKEYSYVTLLLLEDFQPDDERTKITPLSGFSEWMMLRNALKDSKREAEKSIVDPDSMRSHTPSRSYNPHDARSALNSEAVSFLADLGALISVERPITCLFRLRELGYGGSIKVEGELEGVLRVFAYPIFVAASDHSDLAASH